ncbi:MFS transporter [Kordiimonas aestuarii]|uniref:MFS transporter n=1 Tax=Kordiimonas aestuarii TaxID=1005925 RepID=UPI0021D35757|nr:MFS transporter [Kordiimonas aestuarii]
MGNWRIKFSLFLIYFVFAILLNSVGTVILQVIKNYDLSHADASVLEGFKDLPIAIVSFLVASFLPRFGFRNAMMTGLLLVTFACLAMPLVPAFLTTKLLFLTVGVSFALVKVSVYSTVGLITHGRKEHASFMNTLEGIFMTGVLVGYGLFSYFVEDGMPKSQNWLNVYWLLAALTALSILIIYFTPLDESEAHHEGSTIGQDFMDMMRLVIRPIGYIFVVSAFLYVLIEQGIGTWLPTFNNEVLMLPESMSIQATSIFAATLAIGRLSAGMVMARFDWYPVLNVCVLAVGALILISLPMAENIAHNPNVTWLDAPAASYIFPLIGLFLAPIYPAINSAVLSALPKYQHSEMTGLIVIFSALGGTTGSIITGTVFGEMGGSTAFYLSLIPLTGLLASLFFFKRETSRMAGMEADTQH